MTTGETIPTQMTIEKVSSTVSQLEDQTPQWELQVKWPWSNQYPDRVWLNKPDFPDEPAPGVHHVEVEKVGYKKKKDGSLYDGDAGWMFNYRVLRFTGAEIGPGPAQPQTNGRPQPGGEPAPYVDLQRASIERQVCLKVAGGIVEATTHGHGTISGPKTATLVVTMAEVFSWWLSDGVKAKDIAARLDEAEAKKAG